MANYDDESENVTPILSTRSEGVGESQPGSLSGRSWEIRLALDLVVNVNLVLFLVCRHTVSRHIFR